jgi:hypothetical protein
LTLLFARGLLAQNYAVPSAVILSTRTVESMPTPTTHRFEAGSLVANMRLGCTMGSKCAAPQMGIGTGAAFNLNQHFALDSQFLTLVNNDSVQSLYEAGQGGRGEEFLLGVRTEVRTRHYGFFAVDRPGLVSWSGALTGVTFTPTTNNGFDLSYQYQRRTNFADEFGGGAEYSPNDRVHVRVEMADLMVHTNGTIRYDIAGVVVPVCMSACSSWTNNLQTTVGVYMSAGRAMEWSPNRFGERPEHPFLDRTNQMLIATSLLAQAADAITTQRFLRHGIVEGNPIAAPFVKYGWSGQIGLAVLTNVGEIGGMRALHKMHLHRMERMLPLSLGSASAVMSYRNQQISDRPSK